MQPYCGSLNVNCLKTCFSQTCKNSLSIHHCAATQQHINTSFGIYTGHKTLEKLPGQQRPPAWYPLDYHSPLFRAITDCSD